MSHSLHSADRATHIKIVGVAASLTIMVILLGLHARSDTAQLASRAPVKATTAVVLSSDSDRATR